MTQKAAPGNGQKTVLVVEDDAEVRHVAVLMLGLLGYAVLEAGDAMEALTFFDKQQTIDLLLTDVVMPGVINGPDLARKAKERYPDLRVLLMSGHGDDPIERHGGAGFGAPLLRKPYSIEDLDRELVQLFAD